MDQPSPFQEHRIRQRILEAGIEILEERGFTGDVLQDATAAAGFRPEQAQPFFKRDEDLVYALYLRLGADLESRAADLPAGTIGDRFRAAMLAKIGLATPYRAVLSALIGTLANPHHELGVLNPQTEMVRLHGLAVTSAVVSGATDAPSSSGEALARTLYAAHLALMLLWSQDHSPVGKPTAAAINSACRALDRSRPLLGSPLVQAALAKADSVFASLILPPPDSPATEVASDVLRVIFRHRRLLPGVEAHPDSGMALHLPRTRRAVLAGEPIHLVLPAFPAKSPSPRKVIGTLPDKAEEIALQALQNLCDEIREVYAPGAHLTICSDGHVFSDLVGVTDETVTLYGTEVSRMIQEMGLSSIDMFNMSDVFEETHYPQMRESLCLHYAESAEIITRRIHSHPHHQALFNGIHRFLYEDQAGVHPERSATQVRKEARERAYGVIRRSEAWGRLITDCFPRSLRLSIHPQAAQSDKIGILLGAAQDTWITPWHGVAVERNGEFSLAPRHAADALGARIVEQNGRPYYLKVEDI